MARIAVLDSGVRLVVFQFLMKSAQVPAGIPLKQESATPPMSAVKGVEVLPSTPKIDLSRLPNQIHLEDYDLVDVWQKPHDTNWQMSFVRFVFCQHEFVREDKLFPKFVTRRVEHRNTLDDLVYKNVWATQAYLNPYFEANGSASGHKVLMLGCAGRVPNDMVFSGGRDENNRGIGPKVLLSTLSHRLDLTGDEIVLVAPAPVPETVSSPVA